MTMRERANTWIASYFPGENVPVVIDALAVEFQRIADEAREACAKVAESCLITWHGNIAIETHHDVLKNVRVEIAAAIRQPPQPKE